MWMSLNYSPNLIVKSSELNISIWIATDLPIWNFRIYNNINKDNATKMIRVSFIDPEIIYLGDPSSNWEINTEVDMNKLDCFIELNWNKLIRLYNNELNKNDPHIPLTLKKPDYTKLYNYQSTFYQYDIKEES